MIKIQITFKTPHAKHVTPHVEHVMAFLIHNVSPVQILKPLLQVENVLLTQIVQKDFLTQHQVVTSVANTVTSAKTKTSAPNVLQGSAFKKLIFWELYQLSVHKFVAMVKGLNTSVMMEIFKMVTDVIQAVLLKKDGRVMQDLLILHQCVSSKCQLRQFLQLQNLCG